MAKPCILIGAPIDSGQKNAGCLMGPAAYRVAGISRTLEDLGRSVTDRGDIVPAAPVPVTVANAAVHSLPETIAWTAALSAAVEEAMREGFPIVMGGDPGHRSERERVIAAHALSLIHI